MKKVVIIEVIDIDSCPFFISHKRKCSYNNGAIFEQKCRFPEFCNIEQELEDSKIEDYYLEFGNGIKSFF